MGKFNYILSYSVMSGAPTAGQLSIFISQNRDIDSWYMAFPGTYIIKSDQSLLTLQVQFQTLFSPSQFLLTWVAAGHATGLMPVAVWNWANGLDNTMISGS